MRRRWRHSVSNRAARFYHAHLCAPALGRWWWEPYAVASNLIAWTLVIDIASTGMAGFSILVHMPLFNERFLPAGTAYHFQADVVRSLVGSALVTALMLYLASAAIGRAARNQEPSAVRGLMCLIGAVLTNCCTVLLGYVLTTWIGLYHRFTFVMMCAAATALAAGIECICNVPHLRRAFAGPPVLDAPVAVLTQVTEIAAREPSLEDLGVSDAEIS